MAFNIDLHKFLSDQESFDTTLLRVTAGDTINFSFATLSGFLGGSDLPVDGYLSVVVNGVELAQFTGANTGSNSTPPGSEAGTDFLFREGTFSISDVDPVGNITLTYTDPNGSQQFIIAGNSSITLSAHLKDHGDTGSSSPVSDPDIVAINLTVDNPARGTLSQPEQVKQSLVDSLHVTASNFNTLATGFTALSTALGASDSSSLITLLGGDLAVSIAPQLGDVNAAIQTIFARAEAGQSETQSDSLALSLVAMIDKAAAEMLNKLGPDSADAAYSETFVAPDWNFAPITGASQAANALVTSSYAVLQDCAEMLAAAQRYQGAVVAGDAAAQAIQDTAFNAALAQYGQDRVAASAAIHAFLLGVADVTFEADTTLTDVQAYLDGPTDPITQDSVLSAWISAITGDFPGLAAPLGAPTFDPVITNDVLHALELIGGAFPGSDSGSVKGAIDGIASALSTVNHNPVIGITESGDTLPLIEAGIDSLGNPVAGTTTHSFAVSKTDQDGDSTNFAKSGWTLVSGTTYSKAGVYGTATFNILTGHVVYTLNNNDPDTQALVAGQSVIEHFAVSVFDGKGGFDTEDLQINIMGTNDRPNNLVPSVPQSVIVDTDFHFGTQPYNSIQISDDNAELTVTLSVNQGTITFSEIDGLFFTTGDGTGDVTMIFSGNLTKINAALQGLIYSPVAGSTGSAQLTIVSKDSESFSNNDIVNLNIHEHNEAPVAKDDRASVNQYGTISGNVIVGDAGGGVADSDPDVGSNLTVAEVLGGSVGQAFAGAYGVLTLSATGVYTYVANDGQPIAAGTIVEDVFSYLLTDQFDFDIATLTISVTGASTGTRGNNYLLANDAGSTLSGLAGNDILDGGDGDDTLIGGAGRDTLTGGLGADRFDFNAKTESRKGAAHDVILDFSGAGGDGDHIDLSSIDAKKGNGNQAFKFIGAKKFHHKMGELHIVNHGTYVTVEGDITGNGKADFQIDVHNLADALSTLAKGDFIL